MSWATEIEHEIKALLHKPGVNELVHVFTKALRVIEARYPTLTAQVKDWVALAEGQFTAAQFAEKRAWVEAEAAKLFPHVPASVINCVIELVVQLLPRRLTKASSVQP